MLFPGGRLPLRIFEQRYIEMTKACVRDDACFGVCRIVRGDEVRPRGANEPEFAAVGTVARFENWDTVMMADALAAERLVSQRRRMPSRTRNHSGCAAYDRS